MRRTIAALCTTITCSVATAGEGFTFEYDLGLPSVTFEPNRTKIGVALESIGVGAFITPSLALTLRISGTGYFESGKVKLKDQNGETTTFFSKGLAFYGANAQFYIGNRFFVAGGPGLAVTGPPRLAAPIYALYENILWDSSADLETNAGLGLSGRLGVVIWEKPHRATIRLGTEGVYGRVKSENVTGATLLVGIQVL